VSPHTKGERTNDPLNKGIPVHAKKKKEESERRKQFSCVSKYCFRLLGGGRERNTLFHLGGGSNCASTWMVCSPERERATCPLQRGRERGKRQVCSCERLSSHIGRGRGKRREPTKKKKKEEGGRGCLVKPIGIPSVQLSGGREKTISP